MVSSVKFLRETARKVIEVRKSAMKRGEQVPDDILQRIIEQGLLTHAAELFYAGFAGTQPYPTYCLHLLISSFSQSLTHRLTHSFIYSFIHSFIHSFSMYEFIYSLICFQFYLFIFFVHLTIFFEIRLYCYWEWNSKEQMNNNLQ